MASLFIELVGFEGHPGQMTTDVQRALLSFAESALEPYGEHLGGIVREPLKKRWAWLTKLVAGTGLIQEPTISLTV